MTIHSLGPSYVQIFYQSGKGAHVMTRPTRFFQGTAWVAGGTYTAWDDTPVDAATMIEDFIDLLLPLFTADINFTSYTIYQKPVTDEPGIPVFAANLTGKIGTSISTAQFYAYAKTYSYMTEDSNTAKLVLLDVPTGGVVSKSTILPGGAEGLAANALLDLGAAWSGRDDKRIVAFRSISNDVNDALQKKYRI